MFCLNIITIILYNSYFDECAGIIIGCLSVSARSMSLTFPDVLVCADDILFPWDLLDSADELSCPEVITLGASHSGDGKARSEFAEDGDKEHNPRQFGAVSKTCNCWGDAVNVNTWNYK